MVEKQNEELDIRQLDRELNRYLIGIPDMRLRHRHAISHWASNMGHNWDIACSWHAPQRMRIEQRGYSAEWLQRQLGASFNAMRKSVFPHLPRNQRPVIPRFITLEFSEGVGWHAHGLVETPTHLTTNSMIDLMHEAWVGHVGRFATGKFAQRLFWGEKRTGGYVGYTAKNAMELPHFNRDGERGSIDLVNTAPR